MVLITGAEGYIGKVLASKMQDIRFRKTDMGIWDIRNPKEYKGKNDIDIVVHLGALVRVGESVRDPLKYYDTNVSGTINILKKFPNAKIIFASTGAAFDADSPYGKSKVMCEEIIKDVCKEYTIFRFYNVGGGNPTNPEGLPLAIEKAKETGTFTIFGDDYNTKDGTCVRDYVHVEDIADALFRAVQEPGAMTDYEPLGSGNSYTVREYVDTYIKKYGKQFEVVVGDRRLGDLERSEVPFLSKFITPTKTLENIV